MRGRTWKCSTCGYLKDAEGNCHAPTYEQTMRAIFRPRMTDAEASRVVLPKLTVLTMAERFARWHTQAVSGTFESQRDAAKKYLYEMGQVGCCTFDEPCERHKWCFEERPNSVIRERVKVQRDAVGDLLDGIAGA